MSSCLDRFWLVLDFFKTSKDSSYLTTNTKNKKKSMEEKSYFSTNQQQKDMNSTKERSHLSITNNKKT
jgi:hypothetical protein